ncbi:MAG TPA: UbiH/UbiF family hydroxylase [Rhodocyclaceae bacterium]|nr:UbiH/UbiF family hydroxylase [Rhodocyclaceae bacterium]
MNFDVVVVGGGLAGASLAVALQATRLKVALVEVRVPVFPPGLDQRVYAISPASQRFLSRIGAWDRLDRARMCSVREMDIHGDDGGHLRFSSHDAGLVELAWIVESSLMLSELWETIKRQHNVTLLCPAVCSTLRVETDAATLSLADGRVLRARLVVAADGANSWVRQHAGIGADLHPYGQHAVVANFATERPHGQTAYQWFRKDGIVALLPLGEQVVSLVWSCRDALAEQLSELDDVAFCERVREASGGVVGGLRLLSARATFPLRLMRVDKVVKPRVALIGDAAHAIHPLSGHGINLGFGDVDVLARQLESLAPWEDPGDLAMLRRYERARAEEPLLLQYATHALNRLFGTESSAVSHLRNLGMNLTSGLPVLKDALVRYATLGHF